MTREDDDTFDLQQQTSPTDHVLTELQLYGVRPFQDEPDPRPLPDGNTVAGAVADIFDAVIAPLTDTRLEPDIDNLLWSTVNVFHRAIDRVERELERAGTAAQPEGAGRIRGEIGRTGAPDRRGTDHD